MKKQDVIVFITALIMMLSFSALSYGQENVKKPTKKQLIERNADLQHRSDSLVGVTENQAFQIQELQRQIDSINNANNYLNTMNEQFKVENDSLADINRKLSAQIAQKDEEARQAQAYIENKGYYVAKNKQYCEERLLCKDWAHNMAKEMGESFKIVSLSKENSSKKIAHQASPIYFEHVIYGPDRPKYHTVQEYTEMTSIVKVGYVLKNIIDSSKTFKCTARQYPSGKITSWTCNWI